jgi:hypothetical protein
MSAAAGASTVSVELINPDAQSNIRIFLDRKLIYEGTSKQGSQDAGPPPIVVGKFELDGGATHVIIAEALGSRTKAQLEWTPQRDPTAWISIRYYPGRGDEKEAPFFTFLLRDAATKLK